jgi:hypothetical protein
VLLCAHWHHWHRALSLRAVYWYVVQSPLWLPATSQDLPGARAEQVLCVHPSMHVCSCLLACACGLVCGFLAGGSGRMLHAATAVYSRRMDRGVQSIMDCGVQSIIRKRKRRALAAGQEHLKPTRASDEHAGKDFPRMSAACHGANSFS